MNRKTFFTLGTILGIILCIGAVAGWGAYAILTLPSIREGLQTAGGEFSAMGDLQQRLLKAYPCEGASVQIMNGDTLNVSLVNSKFNDMSSPQQAKAANEIALFVENTYAGNAKINQIVITFVENNQIGPLNTNRSFSYPFDVLELNEISPVSG